VNNACRTDPKSPHWDYYQNVDRKALYDVYSKLLTLRSNPKFLTTFASGAMNYDLSGSIKWQSLSSDSLDIMVMGNFDVLTRTGTVTFPATGTWYSYLTDSVTTVGSTSVSITLQPGEYFVFTNRDIKSLILPVQWLRFTAQKTGSQTVELRWSIGSELNNDHFEIQRSGDGVNFSTIGYVLANKEKQYIYADTKPLRTGYYRVKQIDKDARYGYSRIIKVAMEEAMSFQLLPNPARNTASLYSEKELSGVQILMTDLSGKIVYQHGCGSLAAGQQVLIDVQKLARGVYILKVMSDQGTKTKKLAVD
jgi:hypothetical protein